MSQTVIQYVLSRLEDFRFADILGAVGDLVYRHLEWSFDSDSLIADLNFSGPAFGAIFRF